jgi:hypothetical protein
VYILKDPRNKMMEETSRRKRRMEVSAEKGQGPEGAVAPYMDGYMLNSQRKNIIIHVYINAYVSITANDPSLCHLGYFALDFVFSPPNSA